MSSSNINVSIRIEPTDEYQIYEINYDGEEKYIPPLSMEENLTRLIQKIDFNQPIDELENELSGIEIDAQDKKEDSKPIKPGLPAWPYESVRKRLVSALTEICVLNDVLSIAKAKKYMVLDTVCQEQNDQHPITELMAKKRAFQNSAQVLLSGAETLKASKTNSTSSYDETTTLATDSSPLFYEELIEMRKNWRLKLVGTNIIGDLSYYRTGYKYGSNTKFEVHKTNPEYRRKINQALRVKIPPDLMGHAHIQVSIVKDNEISVHNFDPSVSGRTYESPKDLTWQESLDLAQNVLFCKELFSLLARDAVTYQFSIPATVTGNQIVLSLFPEVKLYITMVHRTPHTKMSQEMSEDILKLQQKHNPVFEHSLHMMLRNFYSMHVKKMQGLDISKEQGPGAYDKHTIESESKPESLLSQIVMQAQHLVLRQQTMVIIDDFAKSVRDPMIVSHWFCLNSPKNSIVRLDIVPRNNEVLGRTHMLIYIETRQLRVITRECKNLYFGYEPDELKNLLIWQCCYHQFTASATLSKLFGWHNLSTNYNIGAIKDEQVSTAFSIVMLSPNCDYLISIKTGAFYGLTVSVAPFKNQVTNYNGADIKESMSNGYHDIENFASCKSSKPELCKFQDLIEPFREIHWDKMLGKDFISKLELVMAALTDLKIR